MFQHRRRLPNCCALLADGRRGVCVEDTAVERDKAEAIELGAKLTKAFMAKKCAGGSAETEAGAHRGRGRGRYGQSSVRGAGQGEEEDEEELTDSSIEKTDR